MDILLVMKSMIFPWDLPDKRMIGYILKLLMIINLLINMVQLTKEQRVFVVKKYYETHSFLEVQRLFAIQFPDRRPPVKWSIWKNVKKYEEHGTSLNRNQKNSGRNRTSRTAENLNAVQEVLDENPTGVSCRRNGLGLSPSCFNRIAKIDLNWHPYKIHINHQLKDQDYAERIQFCEWFQNQVRNPRFLANFIIGDEAAFHLNGKVTTQNVRQYALSISIFFPRMTST